MLHHRPALRPGGTARKPASEIPWKFRAILVLAGAAISTRFVGEAIAHGRLTAAGHDQPGPGTRAEAPPRRGSLRRDGPREVVEHKGQLGKHRPVALRRGFPRTHRFARRDPFSPSRPIVAPRSSSPGLRHALAPARRRRGASSTRAGRPGSTMRRSGTVLRGARNDRPAPTCVGAARGSSSSVTRDLEASTGFVDPQRQPRGAACPGRTRDGCRRRRCWPWRSLAASQARSPSLTRSRATMDDASRANVVSSSPSSRAR